MCQLVGGQAGRQGASVDYPQTLVRSFGGRADGGELLIAICCCQCVRVCVCPVIVIAMDACLRTFPLVDWWMSRDRPRGS